MSQILALVSAITALFAVLLAPLVTIWVAQKQTRVAVLSNNRQEWINNVRDLLAEYYSITSYVHVLNWEANEKSHHDLEMKRLVQILSKLRLLLNPQEEDHIRLIDSLNDLARLTAKATKEKDMDAVRHRHSESVLVAQRVLKSEWERVKKAQ